MGEQLVQVGAEHLHAEVAGVVDGLVDALAHTGYARQPLMTPSGRNCTTLPDVSAMWQPLGGEIKRFIHFKIKNTGRYDFGYGEAI